MSKEAVIGQRAKVVSGPHEGRAGIVTQVRDIAIDGREPETYVILEYTEENCYKELQTDHISVPARRCQLQ